MGNEGKLIAIVDQTDAVKALEIIKKSKYGENARIIGQVSKSDSGTLKVMTEIGGTRILDVLQGVGLPRIC